MTSPADLFERTIIRVQAEDDAWHVWLSCGHEATFVVWPHSPSLPCAQCVNAFVEKERLP